MIDKKFRLGFRMREPKTVVELRLIKISQNIRSKKNWMRKIKNSNIISKWKTELYRQGVTADEFQYILDELSYYASLKDGPMEIGLVDGTWQSDGLIEQFLATSFKDSVFQLLENVPESEKDYHPGSNGLVVDLVHPSLFCFAVGHSKIIDETGLTPEMLDHLGSSYSEIENNFRWLPSEVSADENGVISFDSYINNLPPIKNAQLYSSISLILSRFLPLFSRVLRDLEYPRMNRVSVDDENLYEGGEFEFDEDIDDPDQYEQWKEQRVLKWPKVPKFEAPTQIDISDFELKGQKFQIIVKLANIELTPRKPKYKGGVWHVEGTTAECIVATGIYYYSMENITKSLLRFRVAINEPPYEQNDSNGVYTLFGINDKDSLNQKFGSLIACEGRCIVFPNLYQHKVEPFELIDKTKNGHRKILVFFLINPTKRIISTRNVAPQNPIWDDEPVDRFTMSLNEAKAYRKDLMSERKYIRDEHSKELYEREFSLCEH